MVAALVLIRNTRQNGVSYPSLANVKPTSGDCSGVGTGPGNGPGADPGVNFSSLLLSSLELCDTKVYEP